MFHLIQNNSPASLYYAGGEARVCRALRDLSEDFARVCGRRATVKPYLPTADDTDTVAFFLDSTLTEKPEQFRITVTEHTVTVTAGEFRGLLWGIYTISSDWLGVDAGIRFTGIQPDRRADLCVPEGVTEDAPHYRFRGWFVNDEDLLTKWKGSGGARHIDYPFYSTVTHADALDAVLETALRLKINLIIPASFVDIRNPAEEALIKQVTERGLYISQHHVEPMGVSYFGYENYWAAKGETLTACYSQQKEKFEEVWRDSARRWAQYEGVIWQLGLRGRADRPLWHSDATAPKTDAERGAMIGDAMAKQYEIVRETLGGRLFYSTTTLWMEGSALYADGFLKIPPETTVVFADGGTSQMFCRDFFNVPREAGRTYGLYYHIAFWGDGPHLAQANDPRKMEWNYREALAKGDDWYSILNVSSVREVLFGAMANAALLWSPETFDADKFTQTWAASHWGEGTGDLLRAYFDAFPERVNYQSHWFNTVDKETPFPRAVLMDGVTRAAGNKVLAALEKGDTAALETVRESYLPMLAKGIPAFRAVLEKAWAILGTLNGDRARYFDDSLLLQAQTMLALYGWLKGLLENTPLSLSDAEFALAEYLQARRRAEHGDFEGWFTGDDKMNVTALRERTRKQAQANA